MWINIASGDGGAGGALPPIAMRGCAAQQGRFWKANFPKIGCDLWGVILSNFPKIGCNFIKFPLKVTYLKCQSNHPGANESKQKRLTSQ